LNFLSIRIRAEAKRPRGGEAARWQQVLVSFLGACVAGTALTGAANAILIFSARVPFIALTGQKIQVLLLLYFHFRAPSPVRGANNCRAVKKKKEGNY
jgi:hypothetical protein